MKRSIPLSCDISKKDVVIHRSSFILSELGSTNRDRQVFAACSNEEDCSRANDKDCPRQVLLDIANRRLQDS